MILIRKLENRDLIIIFLILISILLITGIKSRRSELLVDKIKESYISKTNLKKEEIEKIKSIISRKNKLTPEENFTLGYIQLFEENNRNEAYKYFEKVIKESTKINSDFAKVYSYKFLSDKYLDEGNVDKAIEYVENSLYSINPNNHGEYRNLINDIIRPIIDIEQGRDVSILFLEHIVMENYKHPNKQAEFYAYRTLEDFYMIQGNYPKAIYAGAKTVELGEYLNKNYFMGKSLTNLARICYKLGYDKEALTLLKKVGRIQAEDDEWSDKLNLHRLIALYEIMIGKGDYNKALYYISKFDECKSNLTDEDRMDIEIVQNIAQANVYLHTNDIKLAQMNLEKAKKLLLADKEVYWVDKDVYYFIVNGNLNEKLDNYDLAIKDYEKAMTLSIERNNIENIECSMSKIKQIYNKVGNEKKSNEYNMGLNQIESHKNKKVHSDYTKYIELQEEIKKAQQKDKINKNLHLVLTIIIIITTILMFKKIIFTKINNIKLRKQIKNNLLKNNYKVYYQPIVNPKENTIIGFEGLIRLKLKDKIIFPYIIIDEIEKANMMNEVSIWILNKIIEDYKVIKSERSSDSKFYISMNMSLKEIEDDDVVEKIIDIVTLSEVEKESICIEITENVGIGNLDKVKMNISKLKEVGILIAIDDFGVEYSNFSTIENIDYDILKFDKTFINDLNTSSIYKDIIKFCDYLFDKKDKIIVFEGVEETNQLEFIKNTQSKKFYVQGYFYSKPRELDYIKTFKL